MHEKNVSFQINSRLYNINFKESIHDPNSRITGYKRKMRHEIGWLVRRRRRHLVARGKSATSFNTVDKDCVSFLNSLSCLLTCMFYFILVITCVL